MIHPYASVYGTYDEDLESLARTGRAGAAVAGVLRDRHRPGLRARRQVEPDADPGALDQMLWEPGDELARRLRQPLPRQAQRTFGRYTWSGASPPRTCPTNPTRSCLDPELTDSDGIPAAKINYTIGENNQRMLDFHVARAVEAHEAAGAAEHRGRSGGPRQRLAPAG